MKGGAIAALVASVLDEASVHTHFTFRPLYSRERSPVPIEYRYSLSSRLCGPQSRSVGFGEEKNLIFSIGIRTVDRPACSLVAMPTTAFRSCSQHHFGTIILHNSGLFVFLLSKSTTIKM